jgi:PAS domain S-box-containing protein
LVAAVLLVIAGTAAGLVLTRVDPSRDAWLVVGTGLALAAVIGVLALTRNRQRQAMPEVERYFTLAPEIVVLAGFDGYWKRANPTVEALLGYTERDWRARPFLEFIHPDDRERSGQETRRVFAGETVRAFENRVLCKDGSHKWIEWTATPVTEGSVIYAVGRDVTERRRSESEQAALQRIATLVAQNVPQADVFDAIAEEIGRLVGAEEVRMLRFDSDGSAVVVGGSGRPDAFPLGSRLQLAGNSVALRVLRTRRPARLDDYRTAAGPLAETARSIGVRAVVGVPVLVEGRVWGAISAGSTHEGPLPPDTEARLDQFTKLTATAIANAEARAEVHRLADEQAALRRVAVLVAQQPSPTEVFTAVTEAIGLLLDADLAVLHVFPGDGTATTVASWGRDGPMLPIGTWFPLDGDSLAARIFETGAAARMHSDDEVWERVATDLVQSLRVRSAVGAPILVEGKLWGAVLAATRGVEPWAENAETRIAAFTELVATAIANADSREARARLADEQGALRRVATMVAQGASPQDLFEAVAEEIGRLLPVGSATMGRYEPDDSVTTVASWNTTEAAFPTGSRWPTEGTNVAWMVVQSGLSARIDDFSAATDPIGVAAREAGVKSAVGSPIVVEGHLWGVMTATSTEGPLPPGTEARLASFTELVGTAIANAESSAELAASRRRIVAASDDARRRIERDLHDGVQQQLVSLGLELGAMKADPPTGDALKEQLASVTEDLGSVFDALVEIARGIHPAILSQGGLSAALGALARRSAVPVELHAQIDGPLPDEVEVAAHYVVAEALTNAAKHARASVVHLDVTTDEGTLTLRVRDDGVGGAAPGGGSGLVGLQDRVEALGGAIKIDSAAGSGTCVVVTLPIATGPDPEIDSFLRPPQEPGSPTSPA